jgi:hypothetical protein
MQGEDIMNRERAEQLLTEAADLQTQYWDKISELEAELGFEIESEELELSNWTVDELIKEYDSEEN